MNVLSSNKEQSVGIVTDPEKLTCIGEFTPRLLKEWQEMLEKVYGGDQNVLLFVRKSDSIEAFALFASSNGENPYVAVCGRYYADGKAWEAKNAE